MAEILPEIFLFRTGVVISSQSGAEKAIGERGILMVGDVPYHTIERDSGAMRRMTGRGYNNV